MPKALMWFRRDLRITDNEALASAIEFSSGDFLGAMIMIDDELWPGWGNAKQHYLMNSLKSLNSDLSDSLIIRHGIPEEEVIKVAVGLGVEKVFCHKDFTRRGMARDKKVAKELQKHGIELVTVGSIYAVEPGKVLKDDGTNYRVYTPFYKGWLKYGWTSPFSYTLPNSFLKFESHGYLDVEYPEDMTPADAGEASALKRSNEFLKSAVVDYKNLRDRADLDGTSKLSIALKWGEIHPRTLLARLGDSAGEEHYRKELAWREFYADVLFHYPMSDIEYLNPAFKNMKYDSGKLADERFEAWKSGRTGYPFVDAGMRQLLKEGWMHNRVRMVTASFLVKDLHLEWQIGAEWFFNLLLDADLASNQHGWQWTAGCGTDAAPYFRIFNPTAQGQKFDPDGEYVRKYIPELRHIDGGQVHEPWLLLDGYSKGYPERIVDHAVERDESLARYNAIKKS
jgi:deoxyribodipyrimidine photo-lyase